MKKLITDKSLRRTVGGLCVAAGALLMWLAPNVLAGAMLFAAGVVLEIVGITLERRDRDY